MSNFEGRKKKIKNKKDLQPQITKDLEDNINPEIVENQKKDEEHKKILSEMIEDFKLANKKKLSYYIDKYFSVIRSEPAIEVLYNYSGNIPKENLIEYYDALCSKEWIDEILSGEEVIFKSQKEEFKKESKEESKEDLICCELEQEFMAFDISSEQLNILCEAKSMKEELIKLENEGMEPDFKIFTIKYNRLSKFYPNFFVNFLKNPSIDLRKLIASLVIDHKFISDNVMRELAYQTLEYWYGNERNNLLKYIENLKKNNN